VRGTRLIATPEVFNRLSTLCGMLGFTGIHIERRAKRQAGEFLYFANHKVVECSLVTSVEKSELLRHFELHYWILNWRNGQWHY